MGCIAGRERGVAGTAPSSSPAIVGSTHLPNGGRMGVRTPLAKGCRYEDRHLERLHRTESPPKVPRTAFTPRRGHQSPTSGGTAPGTAKKWLTSSRAQARATGDPSSLQTAESSTSTRAPTRRRGSRESRCLPRNPMPDRRSHISPRPGSTLAPPPSTRIPTATPPRPAHRTAAPTLRRRPPRTQTPIPPSLPTPSTRSIQLQPTEPLQARQSVALTRQRNPQDHNSSKPRRA
jgi:hypothetical protein